MVSTSAARWVVRVCVSATTIVPALGCTSEIGGGSTSESGGPQAGASPTASSTGGPTSTPGTSAAGTMSTGAPAATPGLLGDDFVFGGSTDVSISVGQVTVGGGADPVVTDPVESAGGTLVSCDVARARGSVPLIDDFEDTDDATPEQDGRAGGWYAYNSDDSDDHVLEYVINDSSPAEGSRALHTSGAGYSWAGIGFGLRWGVENADGVWLECLYDASTYVGLRFWARGNDVTVRFSASQPEVIPIADGGLCDTVEMSCWNSHGVDLTLVDGWRQYTILFDEMESSSASLGPFDPTRIRTMQFDIPSDVVFDFWIDDLRFLREGDEVIVEEPPPDEEGDAG